MIITKRIVIATVAHCESLLIVARIKNAIEQLPKSPKIKKGVKKQVFKIFIIVIVIGPDYHQISYSFYYSLNIIKSFMNSVEPYPINYSRMHFFQKISA